MSIFKKVNLTGRERYTLRNNSRPYSKEEEQAEEQAEKLTKLRFKRIPPIQGTLGYLLRDYDNRVVMNYVKKHYESTGKVNRSLTIKRLIELFDALDENSQCRVDVFDYLCKEFQIAHSVFWGWFQAGAYEDMDAIMEMAIAKSTPEVFATIANNAQNPDPKYDKARELWAKIAGRLKDAGVNVNINNQKTTVNNNAGSQNVFGNFTHSIRKSELSAPTDLGSELSTLEAAEEFEQKALPAANTEFIEAEIINNEEEKLCVERTGT